MFYHISIKIQVYFVLSKLKLMPLAAFDHFSTKWVKSRKIKLRQRTNHYNNDKWK